MEVLVTGGNGFLGRHLCRALTDRGHDPVPLGRSAGDRGIAVDLADRQAVGEALRNRRFGGCIHAAAAMKGVADGDRAFDANPAMTENLLAALGTHPPGRIVAISSVDVHDPRDGVVSERSPVRPQGPYGLSKWHSEQAALDWAAGHSGVCLSILRVTQLFGPGDRGGKFMTALARSVRTGTPLQVFGDASERRDLLFVEDAARLAVMVLDREVTGTMVLAGGDSRPLRDLIALTEDVTGRPVPVEYRPRTKPLVHHAVDVSLLRSRLPDFEPTPVRAAIARTLAE